ncbi:three-helix bundle dimerization domain-containing protein [Microbacterium sp.]|uniref:three-helix bundle dimerization domain-containing protein n=1 Tax=Microbacterium sp. TaxID=51671 RepID=UPI003C16850F
MADKGVDEEGAFRDIVARLTAKYPEVPANRVAVIVGDVRSELSTAKVRDFVPLLAEQEAKKRIKKERKEPK